jgi:hypothetical protein
VATLFRDGGEFREAGNAERFCGCGGHESPRGDSAWR